MATIVNARDVLLQAASPRLNTYNLGNGTIDFGNVTGPTRPSNNADVTGSAINSGVTVTNTSGGIVISGGGSVKGGQTDFDSGTGFFLGYSGAKYKFSIGNGTKKLTWDGDTLGIVGDVSGTSNIDITGQAKFNGSTTVGSNVYSVGVNTNATTNGGVFAQSGSNSLGALHGVNSASGDAVIGLSSTGTAVRATATGTGTGILATSGLGTAGYFSTGLGYAIHIAAGTLRYQSVTLNPPPNNTTTFLRGDGSWAAPAVSYADTAGLAGALKPASNTLIFGWSGSKISFQVDASNYGTTLPIDISGNAATADNAGSAQTLRNGGAFTLNVPGTGTFTGCTIS